MENLPTDVKELKKLCSSLKQQLKNVNEANYYLRKKINTCEKALQIADGLIYELTTKKKEPGLLADIICRLRNEIFKINVGEAMKGGYTKKLQG